MVLGATFSAQQSEAEVPGTCESLLDDLSLVLVRIDTSSAESFELGLEVKKVSLSFEATLIAPRGVREGLVGKDRVHPNNVC